MGNLLFLKYVHWLPGESLNGFDKLGVHSEGEALLELVEGEQLQFWRVENKFESVNHKFWEAKGYIQQASAIFKTTMVIIRTCNSSFSWLTWHLHSCWWPGGCSRWLWRICGCWRSTGRTSASASAAQTGRASWEYNLGHSSLSKIHIKNIQANNTWVKLLWNIARIANAVQVPICLLVSTSVY